MQTVTQNSIMRDEILSVHVFSKKYNPTVETILIFKDTGKRDE